MRMSRRNITVTLVVLLVVLVGSTALADGPLEASGVIQAEEIRIASERQGAALQVAVRAADHVVQGQVLVVLDSSAVQASLQQAEAAVETAQAELERVRTQPRAEEVALKRAQLAIARAELNRADAAWQVALLAVREPQGLDGQILTAQTQVALAAQSTQLAEAEQAKARSVADAAEWGSTERQALEFEAQAAQATLAAARADERAAQVALEHLQRLREKPLALQSTANAAEGAYRVADAAVAVLQAELDDLQAGATAQDRAAAEAGLALALAQQKLAQAQLDRLTIRAPISGTVVASMLNVGETVLPGVTLLTLSDLSEMYMTVYVPASRLGEVHLGQKVDVTTDSFAESFEGQVVHIADEPQYTPRNVATKEERVNTVYGVKIRLSNAEGLLKAGMAGEAVFR